MPRISGNTPCIIDIDNNFIWNLYQNNELAQNSCDKLNKDNNNPHYIVTTYENYVNEQENRRAR